MTIEKSRSFPGKYEAFQKIDGQWFTGSGQSHTEALLSVFTKLFWFFEGPERDIRVEG